MLLCAFAAPNIKPSSFVWLQFIALAYPLWILLAILLIFAWWIKRSFIALIPLSVLLVQFNLIGQYIQYSAEKKTPEHAFRIASFNAQHFGVFQKRWFVDTLMMHVADKKFDIFCLQEFYSKSPSPKKEIKKMMKRCGFNFYSYQPILDNSSSASIGMVTFSRFPIVNKGMIAFSGSGNMAFWNDIDYDGDTFRVFNVHLQSIRFKRKDYQFIQNNNNLKEGTFEGSKNLFLKMKSAYIKRENQADSLIKYIAISPFPVVVCGDFNDVPLSYAYQTIAKNLNDAFVEAGNGIERTYTGPFPSFRIDHILFSKNIKCYSYLSSAAIPSDHKLVEAVLAGEEW